MIDQILRSLASIPKNLPDLKPLRFENGLNLINSLAKLESQKHKPIAYSTKLQRSNKIFHGDNESDDMDDSDLIGKRENPFKNDQAEEMIFYLKKKPKITTIENISGNPLQSAIISMQMILKYDPNDLENNQTRANLAVKLTSLLTQINMRESNMLDEDLQDNDRALLEFLSNDEGLLLSVAKVWLNELFNYSIEVKSAQKYIAVLDEVLLILSKEQLTIDIFNDNKSIKIVDLPLWKNFITGIPLISVAVYDYLTFVIYVLKDNPVQQNYVISLFKDFLLNNDWHPELAEQGMNAFLELGLVESVKCVSKIFAFHEAYKDLVEDFKSSVFDKLKMEEDEKKLEGYARTMFAFTAQSLNYLVNIYENFPQFNPKVYNYLVDAFEKRMSYAMKSFNQDDGSLRKTIHYMFDNAIGRELLANKLVKSVESNPFVLQDEDIQNKKKEYLIMKKINERIAILIEDNETQDTSIYDKLLEESRRMGYDLAKILVRLHFQPNSRSVKYYIRLLIQGLYFSFDDLLHILRVVCSKKEFSSVVVRSVLLVLERLLKPDDSEGIRIRADQHRVVDELTDIMKIVIEKYIKQINNEIWKTDIWKGVVKFLHAAKKREKAKKLLEELAEKNEEMRDVLKSEALI